MNFEIEKASRTGFCFGVKRAIDLLTKAATQYGEVEVLGAIVHNQQVTERLAAGGIKVAPGINDIKGEIAAIGSHGVSPQIESVMKSRFRVIVDTTCPFVRRAQNTARQLTDDGFMTIIYGEKEHPEVKGILGFTNDKGIVTLDTDFLIDPEKLPKKIGVLSQTTQVPAHFIEFSQQILGSLLEKDVELRFTDTICHDIRERQQSALAVARRVDLMMVVGSHTSANSNHLADLCATVTQSHLVETATGIDRTWLKNCRRVGVTSGSSTAEETVNEVIAKLKELS
jgi:4-hydroxy-3-methylbut-2-en-1-yl diphosphate reductase